MSLDFRWAVMRSTAVPSTSTLTRSAPRPICVVVVPSSCSRTGSLVFGNARIRSTSVNGRRERKPTRMPRSSPSGDSSVYQSPSSRIRSSSSAGASPTSWTASTSGAIRVIIAASAASLRSKVSSSGGPNSVPGRKRFSRFQVAIVSVTRARLAAGGARRPCSHSVSSPERITLRRRPSSAATTRRMSRSGVCVCECSSTPSPSARRPRPHSRWTVCALGEPSSSICRR